MKLEELFDAAVVAQLDLPPAQTVAAGTPLRDVLDRMRTESLAAIHIVSRGRLAGVFTEVDFARRVLGRDVPHDASVDSFMTPAPRSVTRESKLSFAFELMSRGNCRHLPVVDADGAPQKLLAVRHLLRYLAERYPATVLAMAPDVHQITAADGG